MSKSNWCLPAAVALALIATVVALTPAQLQVSAGPPEIIHRNGFGGKDPYWVRGDGNIHFDEKAHKISDEHARNALTSEYIKVEANPKAGAVDAEFAHYYYDTPAAPVTNDLVARIWVKGYREGVQLKARVVLPKEKDPKNPDAPLTTLIPGEVYSRTRTWQQLTIPDPADALRKHHPVLHARLGRAVDLTGAYIDQLVVNVYCGAGASEVWIDDLEIGPVMPKVDGGAGVGPRQARPLGNAKGRIPTVEFSNGDILVDGDPFFMIAVRHTDTPLEVLRNALFNTIWFPEQVTDQAYEDAIAAKFFVVPSLPLPASDWDPARPNAGDPAVFEKDAQDVSKYLRKFLAGDAVLMWNLGTGRTTEQVRRVARLADVVRTYDPRRPRAVDLWDGYRAYSSYVEAIGGHRWPLFTSLEMSAYSQWLGQRKALTAPSKLSWTWIQTHLPDWYVKLIGSKPDCDSFEMPIGPHPEQIRILTYLSLAAGYRGIGYWSDRYLAESHHGKGRLLEIAMLNAELEMMKPVLLAAHEPAKWYNTSHPNVRAAVIRGPKEMLVLPVWFGAGDQYCPQQATLPAVTITVPLVPEGAVPWQLTPVGVNEIKDVKRVPAGTEIIVREFDTTAAIVFTSDIGLNGKVVKWQDFTRNKLASTAASWARQQAVEQYNKTLATYQAILNAGGPGIPEANDLFAESKRAVKLASEYTDNAQPDAAFYEARRALRPLRVLIRECWKKATDSLDTPTASPYAVSFYSLPKHWELTRNIRLSAPGANVLSNGGFDLNSEVDGTNGASVSSLPGWSSRKVLLDDVVATATIVNSAGLEDKPPPFPVVNPGRFHKPGRPIYTDYDAFEMKPKPNLGSHCLRLNLVPKPDPERVKQNPNATLPTPMALERSFVSVDSPTIDFLPGTWVRISFWMNVKWTMSTADGVIAYDSSGGEPLSVRSTATAGWRHFHLYRQVPANGKISVSFALTGLGLAYIDEVAIEPLGTNGTVSGKPASTIPPAPKPYENNDPKLPPPRQTDVLPRPREALQAPIPLSNR